LSSFASAEVLESSATWLQRVLGAIIQYLKVSPTDTSSDKNHTSEYVELYETLWKILSPQQPFYLQHISFVISQHHSQPPEEGQTSERHQQLSYRFRMDGKSSVGDSSADAATIQYLSTVGSTLVLPTNRTMTTHNSHKLPILLQLTF
jgi:hypothetical protein